MATKVCTRCEVEKESDDFYFYAGRYFPYCKECAGTADKRRRAADPSRTKREDRATHLRLYGLTLVDYDELLESQGGVCAICGTEEGGHGRTDHFVVDHDHATNNVRGLLCHTCNIGLGGFKDDPALLRAAIRYLS